MNNRPRKHHYVPAFYLAGFTESGSRTDRLFVFDQGQIKSWPSTPENSAHQRDYNSIDLGPEVDPAYFESNVLAKAEGEFSRVIRESISEQALPAGADFNVLMNFVAVTMARTPRIRQLTNQVTDLLLKKIVLERVASEEGWKDFRRCCTEAGVDLADPGTADEFREFILSKQYSIDLDQTSHVKFLIDSVTKALPLLHERHWSLAFSSAGMADFVCSDAPITLIPGDGFVESDEVHLANQHTLLMLPLTRRVALFGSYQKRPTTFRISEFGLLQLNSRTINGAKHVFSPQSDFEYLGMHRQRMRRADLEGVLRKANGKYSNMVELVEQWFETKVAPNLPSINADRTKPQSEVT
jgi:hypothetical protein